MHQAVEEVRAQFVAGVLPSLPPQLSTQLGKASLDVLCTVAVGERCDRLLQLAELESVTSRIWEEVAIAQDFHVGVSKAGAEGWLEGLLLAENSVALPEALEDYIASHIAIHLDPYIDGDVTKPSEERGTSPMYTKLQEAYQRTLQVLKAGFLQHIRP